MPYLLVHHKVKQFAGWKSVFDGHAVLRASAGSKGGTLLRSASDPNDLVILLEWSSTEKARAFVSSDDLKQTMQKAGVVGTPDVYFLEEIERVAR